MKGIEDGNTWHLWPWKNDELFIIDQPPGLTNDFSFFIERSGVSFVYRVNGLPNSIAEAIVDKHNETVAALKAKRDEAIEVLQDISSWLGQGGMWDTKNINLKEMEDRIREGIDLHIKVQAEILSKRKTPAICPCCERGMGG
jgi:hypothetical protein